MVIPNLTPEELVKFIGVAVASMYGSDLTHFTHTIVEEVRSTLDTFKHDWQNTLPRQIKSVVQQVHGESWGKQSDLEPSTPYLGRTSVPGNMSTIYPDNSTALGNPGNIAGTSTSHPGNTSGNVIYIDANSPYTGGVLMGNLGSFLTANLPSALPEGHVHFEYPGVSCSCHTNQLKPKFSATYYQTMSYSPNIPPMGTETMKGLEFKLLGPYGSLGSRLEDKLYHTKSYTLSILT
jgi:hypothetical protein